MGHPAPHTGRPRFDIADIVSQHRAELEATTLLTSDQRRVLTAITLCRTAALGGHLDWCPDCDYEHPAYNSCRNRHCPKCQALAQQEWIEKRSARILPVGHFHVVFTIPAQLRPLARRYPQHVFGALMRAAAQTLLELGHSRLNATLGITTVLHTWTRDLRFHPHVHAIVTAGGIADNRTGFVHSSPTYLFPVKVMGLLLRGKMLDALRSLHRRGLLKGLGQDELDGLVGKVATCDWVVYAKKPFADVRHVLAYLGRYTHRVAISNSRFVDVTRDRVTFTTKDGKVATLTPVDFLRRFIQHVLPKGFTKIRHYGLYAAAHVNGLLETTRDLLTPSCSDDAGSPAPADWEDNLVALTGRDIRRCPRCGGILVRIFIPPASARAPPARKAA